jgi:dTDP-4-amino-4,6-dideoxygalactose transaminase
MTSVTRATERDTLVVSAPSTNATAAEATPLLFPFLDLKAQFNSIRTEVMEAVTRVMESQEFILGREVRLFEQEVAAKLGVQHAIGCASGSDALLLAMMALGIGPGDEVITTPFTFVATAGSIARLGARPVFVDIEEETFNLDPTQIESKITSRTRAIMPVHLFGLPADLDSILDIARAKNLHVIEDAAQAIGARYGDRPVGKLGTFGCFSFFPSKNLGGAGDGGLVTTEDAGLAERLRLLRVHGSGKKYYHEIPGTNSRLDALQAAILRIKLRYVDEWSGARESRAERYHSIIEQTGLAEWVRTPPAPPAHVSHVYNQFSVRCQKRDSLRDHLRRRGIPTEIYYPLPLHLQRAFAYLGYQRDDFPVTEAVSDEVLALPVYPELQDSQQDLVVGAMADFYSGTDNSAPQESSERANNSGH